jgi:chemotaxis protein MotB
MRLEIVGFGEFRPRQPNDTLEGRNANRRVVVLVLDEAAQDASQGPSLGASLGASPGASPVALPVASPVALPVASPVAPPVVLKDPPPPSVPATP